MLFGHISGVQYRGHVSRQELVALQRSAKVLAFPCTFPEGFCIAAAEAMAAGAVPVCSGDFALTTTVGRSGVLIPGHPRGGRWRYLRRLIYMNRFVNEVVRLLTDLPHWKRKASHRRRAAVERFSADSWYDSFISILSGVPMGGV